MIKINHIRDLVFKHIDNLDEVKDEIKFSHLSTNLFSLFLLETKNEIILKGKKLNYKKIAIKDTHPITMAEAEFDGLEKLKSFGARVPDPIVVLMDSNTSLLVMEFVPKTSINVKSKRDLIHSLKNLYKNTNITYGYHKNNYVGVLQQVNQETKSFLDFWWATRIEPMMDLAIEKGHFQKLHKEQLYKIIKTKVESWNLDKDMPRPVHGDLWSGNLLFSEEFAYLIDPSFGFSHPMQDFAMLELFGSPLSFSDYQEIALECKFRVHPEMIEFFQIYPLLVHVNIFGTFYKRDVINYIKKNS
ncbi:MAG: fructosamine kinase family protein [Leptospiraceae bacterium]|nr:fructosamine kinase family protein [Leptospiraceae bacterium]MDW7975900.1 fructosamine kinase family protein [Leptospiraceae bacterium]